MSTISYDPKLTPAATFAIDAFLGALNVPQEIRSIVKVGASLEAPVAAAVTALVNALDSKDEGEARKAYEAARRAAFAARQK